jgi:hypothetical protein
LASTINGGYLRRTGAFHSDERTVARLREKLRIHERAQQCITDVALEAPQALSLRSRQSKTGHFNVFTLNSLKNLIDTHALASCGRSLGSFRYGL